MTKTNTDIVEILEFWHKIEFFTPVDLNVKSSDYKKNLMAKVRRNFRYRVC